MRILFCPSTPVSRRLGSSKVYIEIAEALAALGWTTSVVGPEEVAAPQPPADLFRQPGLLRDYLKRRAREFDVVEYEHHQLPYPRADFPPEVLFVARSVLLAHTQAATPLPAVPKLRARIVRLVRGDRSLPALRRSVENAERTMAAADLVNVSNRDDFACVSAAGHAHKAILLPFGLTTTRRAELATAAERRSATPVVAFIGTFDPRKGMAEFSDIVETVLAARPDVRFKLLGTRGLVPDRAGVLSFFRRAVHANLEVVPAFEPAHTPGLLAGAWLGIFPSHVEGFPFSVLELLAAGLPVVAYRAPGPTMMLGDELLVPRGNGKELGRRVLALLADPGRLAELQAWALRRAAEFQWHDVAVATARVYEERLALRRAGAARTGTSS
jgi:glycosyltransferase involved in cell wall biosynthesis